MTPKEKAKEIIFKFWDLGLGFYEQKKCALIAVDEILKANAVWYEGSIPYKYWQKVKQEIEKL